jgi:small conductance mechanosensitive channel
MEQQHQNDTPLWVSNLMSKGIEVGQSLLLAVTALLVGRWLIGLASRVITNTLAKRKVDATLARYVISVMGGVLNIFLLISVLGILGIQTTSFAALLAAAGLAVGSAMSGLLSNFAAGIFLQVLRPFKVGDFIQVGNVTGIVQEIGLFVTIIDTSENVRTFVGNGRLFADNIQNFSTNSYRRVDVTKQFGADIDIEIVSQQLKERLQSIPNVLVSPEPEVEVLEFKPGGPLLTIRCYCHNTHYWQVYFDTTKVALNYCERDPTR